MKFSETYGQVRSRRGSAREGAETIPESVVQCVWYDQLFSETGLRTDRGQLIKVLSPGWWNHEAGPDFKGAQIEFGGNLRNGDVEIHLTHAAWRQHGHHLDERYDNVMLVVVLDKEPPRDPPVTASGHAIPCLLLGNHLDSDIRELAERLLVEEYPYLASQTFGRCANYVRGQGPGRIEKFLGLAGEWRMLNKARALRERMDRAGEEQAIYEGFLSACGFSHFKHHFQAIARQLPYERARQLGRQDPLLLETAFLQIAGLLPEALPEGTGVAPHYARLRALRRDHLGGLRSLPLAWKRVGVRPNNNPERRLAGAARFLARHASKGLVETLDDLWREDMKPVARRKAFEALFPAPGGFWAAHCTWTGKKMERANAPLGPGRVRSIIGNVFVPAALAAARRERDRIKEERVFAFFAALPKEPDNSVVRIMAPRVFGEGVKPRENFRMQQGLLQMYQDWCEPNPSCHGCTLLQFLDL
jgi:hypothetical protein